MQPIASPEAHTLVENGQQALQFNFPVEFTLDELEKNWKQYTGTDQGKDRFMHILRGYGDENSYVRYEIVVRNNRRSHELRVLSDSDPTGTAVVIYTEEIMGVQDAASVTPSLADLFSGDPAHSDGDRDLIVNWEAYFGETVWRDKFTKKLTDLEDLHGPLQLEYRIHVPDTDLYYVDVRRAQHLPEVLATFAIQVLRNAENGALGVGEVSLMQRTNTYQPKLDEDPFDPNLQAIRPIQVLPGWFTIDGVIEQWSTIFNERVLLAGAAGRLKDLEESARQQGKELRVMIKPISGARMVHIEVYRDLAPGQPISPEHLVDVIRVETAVVDNLEQAIQVKLSGDFVSSRHRPLKDPAQVVAESTQHAEQFNVAPYIKPTDIRTADDVQFTAFVDAVRRTNIADTDRARLDAFEQFVQTCATIENDLYYHCTALGQHLEVMLAGGRRPFLDAIPGAPASSFAAGGRWGDPGTGISRRAAPLATGHVAFNPQHASDVVISIYSRSGSLIGVYQCNFLRASA